MTKVRVLAPAKINLTLHVTGQRKDGYHTLDSLVAFAPLGDILLLSPSDVFSLAVTGPEAAGVPTDMSNLAMRAAAFVDPDGGSAMTLEKHLPAASGIGGGSSDAAAAVRGMLALVDAARTELRAPFDWSAPGALAAGLLGLGADVPMCLMPRPLRAQGIGERVSLVSLPDVPALLVNPRVPVATPDVFHALDKRKNSRMPAAEIGFSDTGDLIHWLAQQRNDLETPAIRVEPVIGDVLSKIRETPGCRLARMSGSGATCFGLYHNHTEARAAAMALELQHPDWWIHATWVGDCSDLAAPVRSELH